MIEILLADDHRLVRAGLRMLLEGVADFNIVGEADNGRDAVDLVGRLQPDILVLDLAMPGMTGIEVLNALCEAPLGKTRVVVLSMHGNEEHVLRALRHGATAFVVKDAAPEEMEAAIRAALNGEIWLSGSISRQVIDNYLVRMGVRSLPAALTERQQTVLRLIAEGRSTKEIGQQLHLSSKTIETYRAQIMEKLDIHDIAGLVRYAIRNHIISA